MFPRTTKILLVDDSVTIRELLKKNCIELGFTNITEAVDGENAWELIEAATPPFELILADWNMPRVNGLELLIRIRVVQRHKSIPFIMVSTESEKLKILEAISTGANNYIIKPFTVDQVRQKLEAVHASILAKAPK